MAISYVDFTKKLTIWLIIIASLSTTLRTAVLSTSLGLLVLAWLFSANYTSKFERVKHNPAALAALALFVLYGIGTLYSSADWDMRLEFLGKYHKLLYIPLIVSVMDADKYRRYALN